ncbi:MAG: histidinol-phosphate transaminase, partial [Lachnospiraceae bacterium]|nr:histidinol-phosphate transaminase [Lachnospiraceae bacterium]
EWKKNVREVTPYIPGEQPQSGRLIKLNTNENPYPPAPGIKRLMDEIDTDRLRLYPDPDVTELVCALADYHGIDNDRIFVGVGSDDVLAMSFLTFFNSDKPVLFPAVTYSFYDVWADLYKIKYETPALREDFTVNPQDYIRPNGGIVIANPNAPTSIAMEPEAIESIVAANKESVVIIDEAYIDFGGKSVLPLIDRYDNLLVVRTYSKSRAMAGMRIGYAAGNPELINALNSVKGSFNSYTMNMVSIVTGVESLKDEQYFRYTIKRIMNTREKTKEALEGLGFKVLPSMTNFVFVSHETVPAKFIFEELKKENIYVRYFNKPVIDNYLRITVGTDEEMDIFLKAAGDIIGRYSGTV